MPNFQANKKKTDKIKRYQSTKQVKNNGHSHNMVPAIFIESGGLNMYV